MARKKSHFTRKKKALDKKAAKATPDGLSEREFLALSQDYGSFIVEDSEHDTHTFCLEELAYIQHYGSSECGDAAKDNHWIAKIKEIRGDSPNNVWIRVQWFWSPQEVAEVIKSFDPAICGKYEKLFSNNFDFISVHCVVEHVDVKHFDETSIYQDPIKDEEWFTRYTFLYDGRRVTPKVARAACSICKIPYTPGAEKILHFCPRPRCCQFYHQACLVKNGYVEETRSYRVLETWPDIDRTVSVEDLVNSFHPRKRQKRNRSPSKESMHHMHDPLAGFPPELVAIAQQQILRGIQGGGVVGNVTSVAAARQFIYRALTGGSEIPEDWETRVDTSMAVSDSGTLPHCICPSCYSPI